MTTVTPDFSIVETFKRSVGREPTSQESQLTSAQLAALMRCLDNQKKDIEEFKLKLKNLR